MRQLPFAAACPKGGLQRDAGNGHRRRDPIDGLLAEQAGSGGGYFKRLDALWNAANLALHQHSFQMDLSDYREKGKTDQQAAGVDDAL